MAYVKIVQANGQLTGQKISHQQAVDILDVLEGRKQPENDKQATFCGTVHKVYFAWRNADPLWIMANIEAVIPLALSGWAVNHEGRPTRPDSEQSWQFAKKYQLWQSGAPYGLAKHYIDKYELKAKGYK